MTVNFKELLTRTRNQAVNSSINSTEVAQLVERKGVLAAQERIITIDFKTVTSFTDPSQADSCLVVVSSDGFLGTLTHLQVNTSVVEFVDNLSKIYAGKTASICLSGAGSPGEYRVAEVVRELKQRGFKVSLNKEHATTGGLACYRRATVYSDKVQVILSPYSGKKSDKKSEVTLSFPE